MGEASDTTGTNAAESSPRFARPTTPAGHSKDIEEAKIIDEVVIRPPSSPVPIARPGPSPIPPPPPLPPPPPVRPATVTPPSIAHDSLEEKPRSSRSILPPTPTPPVPEARKVPPSAPTPPASLSHASFALPKEIVPPAPRQDFQHILEKVKLPERTQVPHEEEERKPQTTFDTTLASPLAPHTEAPPQPATPQVSDIDKAAGDPNATTRASSIVVPVHTLKDDFQGIVRERKMSLVRAAALEQDKRRNVDKRYDVARSGQRRRSFGIIFASVLFALLGTGAFLGVALVMQERGGTAPGQNASSLLFAESSLPLPIENLASFDIKRLLSQARLSAGTLGSITRIIPTVADTNAEGSSLERAATLQEFLEAIDAGASPELTRALGSEFFFGLHTVDENAPIFIAPVLSYERAFAGMLAWEETLNTDLVPVFTAVPTTKLGASGLLEERRFEDVVMRNYDVRVLTDDAGTIQLYYSFPTRELLIIAESPYSFAEILARLRAERKL